LSELWRCVPDLFSLSDDFFASLLFRHAPFSSELLHGRSLFGFLYFPRSLFPFCIVGWIWNHASSVYWVIQCCFVSQSFHLRGAAFRCPPFPLVSAGSRSLKTQLANPEALIRSYTVAGASVLVPPNTPLSFLLFCRTPQFDLPPRLVSPGGFSCFPDGRSLPSK